jgi:hypothetical protein
MEPAETLRKDNQAAHTRESRQPVSQPPVDYIKLSNQSKLSNQINMGEQNINQDGEGSSY